MERDFIQEKFIPIKIRLCYVLFLACFILGCGNDDNPTCPNAQVAKEIIQKYNFQTVGDPIKEEVTLPQELTDANWGPKEIACEQAGYTLAPYAGQDILSIRYSIVEQCDDEALYLWILIKNNKCICTYTAVRVGSGLNPRVFAVNDACFN